MRNKNKPHTMIGWFDAFTGSADSDVDSLNHDF